MPYLVLSVTDGKKWSIFRPWALFDLGHVDILCWDPPAKPRSFGLYVSPASWWRVFLSLLYPQRARMVESDRPTAKLTYWKAWRLEPDVFAKVKSFLEEVTAGCASGFTRYRALRKNCFHLAITCLRLAGIALPRVPAQWVVIVPTLGSRSLCRELLADAACSNMEAELLRDLRGLDRWAPAEEPLRAAR